MFYLQFLSWFITANANLRPCPAALCEKYSVKYLGTKPNRFSLAINESTTNDSYRMLN